MSGVVFQQTAWVWELITMPVCPRALKFFPPAEMLSRVFLLRPVSEARLALLAQGSGHVGSDTCQALFWNLSFKLTEL